MNFIDQFRSIDELLHRIAVSGDSVGLLWQARQMLNQLAHAVNAAQEQPKPKED